MTNDEVIDKGEQAGRLLSVLRPRLRDRQDRILKNLIQHHIDGMLTETIMRSGIAAIAELRALERDLASDMEKGHSAMLREVGGRPGHA